MESLPLLLSFFALSLSSMDLALTIVWHLREHKRETGWSIVLSSSLLGMIGLFTLDQFSYLMYGGMLKNILHLVWEVFYIADCSFLIVFCYFYMNWVIAKPMARWAKAAAFIEGGCYLAVSVLYQIFRYTALSVVKTFIGASIVVYGILLFFCYRHKISNHRVKIALRTFMIISFSMVPVFICSILFPWFSASAIMLYAIAYFIYALVFLFMVVSHERNDEKDDSAKSELTLEKVSKYKITERELDVVKLIKQGYTNKEIADKLCISVNTVNNHIANIFSKTEVRSRIDLLNLLEEASW